MRLQNKTALVTGGSRGVGRSTVERFLAEGAVVYLTDIHRERGEAVAAELGAYFIAHDVASEADWQAVANRIIADGAQLDIVVNNAAILQHGNIFDESLEGWRRMMAVNSDGMFLAIKTVLPMLEASGVDRSSI